MKVILLRVFLPKNFVNYITLRLTVISLRRGSVLHTALYLSCYCRNLDNPERNRVLEGHTGVVYGVAFSEDNKLVASGSSDCSVRLWYVCAVTFMFVAVLLSVYLFVQERDFSETMMFVPLLLLLIRDLDNPAGNRVLKDHTACVFTVAFSRDNKFLAFGSDIDSVCIW